MKKLTPLSLGYGEKDNPIKVRRVKKTLRKLLPLVLIISMLTLLAVFLTSIWGSTSVVNYIFSGNEYKSSNNRVNILLLGIAGGTHDGSNLTDTIMVASYNLKTNRVDLFSLPRDLWLPALKSKANAVYEIGLSQNNGLGFSKTIIGNILAIPIHYALRIDFRGFTQAVDVLGGIDVYVDKSFDDYNYPIEGKENDLCGFEEKEIDFSEEQAKQLNIEPGKKKVFVSTDGKIATDSGQEDQGAKYFSCRYEHINFKAGMIHMDGDTVLKYVRSRHGSNGEASDFARSKRQQTMIESIRKKVLSVETLVDPKKISDLIKAFGKGLDTDISIKEAVAFYKLSKKLDNTHTFVLDDSPKQNLPNNRTSLLIHPLASDYGGAYVLISQDDDFSIIQGYVRKVLTGEIQDEATTAARPRN